MHAVCSSSASAVHCKKNDYIPPLVCKWKLVQSPTCFFIFSFFSPVVVVLCPLWDLFWAGWGLGVEGCLCFNWNFEDYMHTAPNFRTEVDYCNDLWARVLSPCWVRSQQPQTESGRRGFAGQTSAQGAACPDLILDIFGDSSENWWKENIELILVKIKKPAGHTQTHTHRHEKAHTLTLCRTCVTQVWCDSFLVRPGGVQKRLKQHSTVWKHTHEVCCLKSDTHVHTHIHTHTHTHKALINWVGMCLPEKQYLFRLGTSS